MMVHSMVVSDETESVGRVGELLLDYVRRGDQTILTRSYSTSPWHLTPPIELDQTGSVYQPLLNPSGGLVGGDRLSIHATVGAGAHVILSTPSANRVYRSRGEPSSQSVHLAVGPGAIAEWVPEVTIPFAGSRFRQVIHVKLDPGATVLLWDAMASGRVARGERWAFASLENEIQIVTASDGALLERWHLAPGPSGGIGLAGEWDYVASLHLIGEAFNAEDWKRLEEDLAVILDERPGLVLGGVSVPAAPGLSVKLVAREASALNATLEALWATIRRVLWSLPAPVLRRY
jgi:urease accessory protein